MADERTSFEVRAEQAEARVKELEKELERRGLVAWEKKVRELTTANTRLLEWCKAAQPALNATLEAMRGLRRLAFTGSRIPYERYPEKQAADVADKLAVDALKAWRFASDNTALT